LPFLIVDKVFGEGSSLSLKRLAEFAAALAREKVLPVADALRQLEGGHG